MDPPHIFFRPSGFSHHHQAPQDPFQPSRPQDLWGTPTPPSPSGLTGTPGASQPPLSGSSRSPDSFEPPTPSLLQSSPIPGPLSIALKTTFRPLSVLGHLPGSFGPQPLQAPFGPLLGVSKTASTTPRLPMARVQALCLPDSLAFPVPSQEPLRFPSDLEAPQRALHPREPHVDALRSWAPSPPSAAPSAALKPAVPLKDPGPGPGRSPAPQDPHDSPRVTLVLKQVQAHSASRVSPAPALGARARTEAAATAAAAAAGLRHLPAAAAAATAAARSSDGRRAPVQETEKWVTGAGRALRGAGPGDKRGRV